VNEVGVGRLESGSQELSVIDDEPEGCRFKSYLRSHNHNPLAVAVSASAADFGEYFGEVLFNLTAIDVRREHD